MAQSQNPVSVDYFRNLLQTERIILENKCQEWRETLKLQEAPQNVEGDILVAIGQAELLMRQRFVQFSGLIDDCEFKRGEKETTCQDLQGFWDIVNFQVEDIKKKFGRLADLQANNWMEPQPKAPLVVKKKRYLLSKPAPLKSKLAGKTCSSGIRAHILAAQQKLKNTSDQKKEIVMPTTQHEIEDKENNPQPMLKEIKSPDKSVFDAGFFKVVTPVKKQLKNIHQERPYSPGNVGKVLSSAVLRERMRATPIQHKDYSPCMRITRSMKLKGMATKLEFKK